MSEPPRVVGRYVVHAEIAAGGMATVHVGRLLGPVGFSRTVAIKRLHPQFAKDPEFVAMFLDEARLAARIRHPNVVSTIDVVAEGGELFLVMDYIEGESLARLVGAARRSGGPPPPAIVATVVAQALHGLHAAHEARDERGHPLAIVHRDMSPQNVLVGTDGVARVLDFGVAKAIGRASITREGELKGKLPYMAPEQIKRKPVTQRTDVYAAGVVLWEALAARRLFEGEGEAEILASVLDGASAPPSASEEGIPPSLDVIVMRALSRDPSSRFATAREMALAIEGAIGVVPNAEIGAWVAALAAEGIAKRARVVATIESSPGFVPSVDVEATAPKVAASGPSPAETIDAAPTIVTRGDETLTIPLPVARPPRRRRRAVAIAAGGVLMVGAAIAIAAGRGAEATATGTAAATATGAATATATATASGTGTATATATAAATASATGTAAAATTGAAGAAATPTGGATATATATNAGGHPWVAPKGTAKVPKGGACNPPYYYENGIKRFKPECL